MKIIFDLFVSCIFIYLCVAVPHELGHLVVALLNKYDMEEASILCFLYDFKKRKLKIRFKLCSYIKCTPNTTKGLILFFGIGLLVNFITGILCICIDTSYSIMFGVEALLILLINLIPINGSDGELLYYLLKEKFLKKTKSDG